MNIKYRPEIDGLRAIAIVSVVIYHAGFVYFLDGSNLSVLPGGYLGVDIFFVISVFNNKFYFKRSRKRKI